MEVTSSSSAIDTKQVANSVKENKDEQTPEVSDGLTVSENSFSEFMKTALGGAGKTEVNEEELFAALIGQRLSAEHKEAADYYEQQKTQLLSSMRRADGYVSYEEVGVKALQATLTAGKIDEATAEKINGEAFAGAQLDSNLDALYDGRGSDGDTTIAVAAVESALTKMQSIIDGIESGATTAAPRPLDAPMTTPGTGSSGSHGSSGSGGGGSDMSGSQSLDGSGGFLWKPVSENDKKLVVLLPTELRGSIDRVEIHSSLPPEETTKLGSGRFTGDTHNGERPHFRFDKPGADFGDDVYVVAFKDDGSTVTWNIADGSARND